MILIYLILEFHSARIPTAANIALTTMLTAITATGARRYNHLFPEINGESFN